MSTCYLIKTEISGVATAAHPEPRERFLAQDRKIQIVQTVLHLVNERGIEAVSTQLIADTIGRSQGVVFRHFPTKEALWSSVIEWLRDRLENVWTEAHQHRGKSALEKLEGMFVGHITLIDKYPGLAKLVMSDHLRHQFPSINESFRDLHRNYERHVVALLEEAVRDGTISSAIGIPDAATLYFCAIQGLGFQFAIARLRRTQLTADGARLFKLLVRALVAQPNRNLKSQRNR